MDLQKITEKVAGNFVGNQDQELVSRRDRSAGCEKLPEGAMRDNCEKKKTDKKEAAKGEVPEAFKKEWKNKDKDGDGKENEPKPDFLKKKESGTILGPGNPDGTGPSRGTGECPFDEDDGEELEELEVIASTEAPKGVVAAMTQDGKIEIFAADTPKAAAGIKEALMAKGGYQRIASGPNADNRTVSELYADMEQRWMQAGCEKLPEGPMRDNCEKKKKENMDG